MSNASNLSKSVASASPTLVHFNQDFAVQHLHGPHQTNLMDITQNPRNFAVITGFQTQEVENSIQDLNRGSIPWGNPMQERPQQQQQPNQPWIHYGPPTLSPIQAPTRCYPDGEDAEGKGQKRTWSDMGHFKPEEKDRKKIKPNYSSTVESKDLECQQTDLRKMVSMSATYGPIPLGSEMLGCILSPTDPGKLLSKDLQQKMNKFDGEIATIEQTIVNLKMKCSELSKEKMLSEKGKSPEVIIEVSESRPQTIARLIYSQNKLKAQQSHNSLSSLGTATSLPLYNQPSDTMIYHDNKKRFQTFKKLLVTHLAKKQQAEKIRIRYLSERYNQLYNQWVKKLHKRENNSCRKEKDTKFREFFEKVFPDLKKQKEDKDKLQRFAVPGNRPAGYARSDAGIEEIVNELHEQEVKEKRMVSLSVTPPMMLDSRQRSLRITDETRLIRSFDFRQKLWTTAESEIFTEKYQLFPKKFGIMASSLENKTVQDCVLFYYLTKKAANYKQMVRRHQAMRKRDKKFRTAQNIQNQENKSGGDLGSTDPSLLAGPGFSHMSMILLPISSSLASSINASITSALNSVSCLTSAVTSSSGESKYVDCKKEQESVVNIKPERISGVPAEEFLDAKSGPLAVVKKEVFQENSVPEASPPDKQEIKTEVATNKDGDLGISSSLKQMNEETVEAKSSNADTKERKTPSKDPFMPLQLSLPCTSDTGTASAESEVAVVTPASDKTTTPYTFPGMRVEDISDKEDSDSVATLSADEGPTVPIEEKDLTQVCRPQNAAVKRPRLLDDGYKGAAEKKKHCNDVVMSWDVKESFGASKRHLLEENMQFYMVPNSERERKPFLPPELQDLNRQLDTSYHEAGDGDLLSGLMRKNRSPARIKDLIHAAIEKNLQNVAARPEGDLNGCASPPGSWPTKGETQTNRLSSPQIQSVLSFSQHQHQLQQQFQQHFMYQKQHSLPPMETQGDLPTSRHVVMQSPATNDLSQQHLALKTMTHERPNSYSPSRFQSPHSNPHEITPPAAHSHHHQLKNTSFEKPSSRGAAHPENNRLYELAIAAAERGRMDEKEKRLHKDNARELMYPGNLPLSLLRLSCDPASLHKGLPSRNNSAGSSAAHSIHTGSGRGSITKGTSGRSEAIQQQGSSMERHIPHDWPGPPRTTSAYPLGTLGGLPGHPLTVDYLSPAQVLRGDFLTAHQMGQHHFSQQNQLFQLQQQLHQYQGINRQGEKKHRQSPALSNHEVLAHSKNHMNQEPVRKKSRVAPENIGKSIYVDQPDYPTLHKKPTNLEEVHKQMPAESRAHSRNQQQQQQQQHSLHYYQNPLDTPYFNNDSQLAKSSHQQNLASDGVRSMEHQKMGKKELQPPSQMTAANLIEAIIYLQINRNETDENALKMTVPGVSSLTNASLLSQLGVREEGLAHERSSRNQPGTPHAVSSVSSTKSYDKLQKYSQLHSAPGDYSMRSASENKITPERGIIDKNDEMLHLANKHPKDAAFPKRPTPYDHLNQLQQLRRDSHPSNSMPVVGKKFITASDRIEAIIAQDIGNRDDMPVYNEAFHKAIKEYMRVSDGCPSKFDNVDSSLMTRFPYASVRSFEHDKSYLPFYPQGTVPGSGPLRLPAGPPLQEDKLVSSQSHPSPKVWQHGNMVNKSERNMTEPGPIKLCVMESKQSDPHQGIKDQRSVTDNTLVTKSSLQLHYQLPQAPKMSLTNSRNVKHATLESMPCNSTPEKTSSKDLNCPDLGRPSSSTNLHSPPVFSSSHINWKTKMLRQHKEQKIAENSQYHGQSNSPPQSGIRNLKEDLVGKSNESHSTEKTSKEEVVKLEGSFEHKESSRSNSATTPPTSGLPPVAAQSSSTKAASSPEDSVPHPCHSGSPGDGNDPPALLTSSAAAPSYWSLRSSTGKCSSGSSDGLRIDLPDEGEEEKSSDDNKD